MNNVHVLNDHAAVHLVVDLSFAGIDNVNIEVTTGGFDVDGPRPGPYAHTKPITYDNLMWEILNHIAYYGTANIVGAVTGDSIDFHSNGATWSEVRITLPSDDPESYGNVYTITPKEK